MLSVKSGSVDKKTVSGVAKSTAKVATKRDIDMTLLNVLVHLIDATGEVAIRAPITSSVLADFGPDYSITLIVTPNHRSIMIIS